MLTFAFVVVTWVFFRAKVSMRATNMLQSMFSPSSFGTATKIDGLENATMIQAGLPSRCGLLLVLMSFTTQGLMRIAMRSPMYRPYVEHATALADSAGSQRQDG